MSSPKISHGGAVSINEGSVGKYYLLALAISWAVWIPVGASQAGLLPFRVPVELPILAQFGPSATALLLVGAQDGRTAVRALLSRLVRWRFHWRWYAVAVLLIPSISGLLLAVHRALGGSVPRLSAFTTWYVPYAETFLTAGPYAIDRSVQPSIGLISWLGQVVARGPWHALLVFLAFAIATGPLSEELGWRGYALPILRTRHSQLGASLLVGLLWGMWHTGPDFWRLLLRGNAWAILYPVVITGGTLPLSILLTWLVENAGGSLLPALLLHASFNSWLYILSLTWTSHPSFQIAAEMVGVLWIMAALVAMSWRKPVARSA